jgi:hypothetical protein
MDELYLKSSEDIMEYRKVMMEKVEFLSENKNIILDNLSSFSYPLFKVLVSDKSLNEIEEYDLILSLLNNKKSRKFQDICNEKYILEMILGFVDRVSTDYNEKEVARKNLTRYNNFFDNEKVKIKVQGA